MPVCWLISAISVRIAVDRVGFVGGERGPFLVDALDRRQPALVELVADIAIEEVLARHLVALGEAQHLPAQRGQAAVEAVELVDEIFDLGVVELDALDLGGQLLAQLLILALVGADSSPPALIWSRRLACILENFL